MRFYSPSNKKVNNSIFPFVIMGFLYLILLIARASSDSASADNSCEGVQVPLVTSHSHIQDPQFEVGRCGVLKAVMKSQLQTPQVSKMALMEQISLNATEKLAQSASPIALHSRPSSTRKLFLDFNGYVISSSSAWNGYWTGNSVRGVSLDGNYSDFSPSENSYIQEIWKAVSEDFSAFDIDVTTVDPGVDGLTRSSDFDVSFGAHAVISDDYSQSAVCRCGGVAYVGVVDYIYSSAGATNPYSPSFNFVSFSKGNYVSASDAAGIISHETGHNVGLGHDGNASTGYYPGHSNGIWAPIMGTSYNKSISQWSKNENLLGRVTSWTQRANSEWVDTTECTASPTCRDDFLVIIENNIPLIADDFGGDGASSYAISSKSFTIAGQVGANEDEDWFKITAGGPITLSATASPIENFPNLDIELILKGSNGLIIVSNNPLVSRKSNGRPQGVNAALSNQMLAAGTYYLIVRGTGALDPLTTGYSRYASVGRFTLTGQITDRKTSQTITFAPPTSLTSAQFPYTLTATASSGLALTLTTSTPAICTVSGMTLTLKIAGTCTLVASQAGNSIYNPAPSITRSITLTKAPQTITFSPAESINLSQSPYTLTATASSGLTVSFTSTTPSICTVSGNLLTVRAAGSCSVAANQTGNSTYASAPSVSRAITTTKAPQTIAFAPPVSLTNAQSPYTLTATASSGLAVTVASSTPDICTVSALRLTLVAAGTCTLVASQAGSSVYERAMNVQARIAITGNPTFTVGTKYQTGRYSIGVAINRSTAYVTNPNDGTISVIDLKNSTSTKFTIGGNPWCIQINGENAYVSDLSGNRISIVSLLTQKVVGIINVVGPYNFIIERGKIYVAGGHQNEGGLDNKLSVFELSSLRLINSVPIGGNPTSVAVMGNLAFIANSASTYVSVIDLSTFTLVENIFLPSAPISVFATNDNLYVTLPNRNALAVIKLENRQLVDEISVGTSPFGVSVYKNSYAFVTNSSSGNLSIVNLSTKMELARITISDYPNYVVFDEGAAYVLSSGDGQNLGALTKIRMMWL